ncbi:hypothetical protein [Leptospira interrogans]|uniref:hypothetical protein n=1 Tax=Leptospira interrogans TaxID=173 RepID=UPI000349B472
MFYGDFVSNFFSLDSILFALFDILTLFQGRLFSSRSKNSVASCLSLGRSSNLLPIDNRRDTCFVLDP